ncbi:MAG: S41 family peptidase [Deltaproteobacteria bacterium]
MKNKLIFLVVFLQLLPLLNSRLISQSSKLFEIAKNIEIYTNVYKELNKNFVDEIDPGILMKTGIDAMTKSLDPYTVYYSESEAESYRISMEGKYSGIGTVMKTVDSVITIAELYKDSPAYKAGLRIGDKLIEVNGKSTAGKSSSDITNIVRGAPGTEIDFKVQSYGEKITKQVKVIRGEIKIPNVPFNGMINDSIAYIQLTTFTENAGDNVKIALKSLKDSFNVKGVILDLRDNGGGLLREAINVANIFIENDQEIVFTRGKLEEQNRSYKTTKSAFDLTLPLAVLINDKSASASEIVSGSIQDLDRGILVGQKSFGKGLVQNFFTLGYNSRVKMTVSKYYIPSGRCIQSKTYENGKAVIIDKEKQHEFKTRNGRIVYDVGGVEPDIIVAKPEKKSFVLNLLKDNMIFKYANEYINKNKNISLETNFRFEQYDDFQKFLLNNNYSYKSVPELKLEELKNSIISESKDTNPDSRISDLNKLMIELKSEDEKSSVDIIKNLIKKEILLRLYLPDNGIKHLLYDDPDIAKAVEILADKNRYNEILNKKG